MRKLFVASLAFAALLAAPLQGTAASKNKPESDQAKAASAEASAGNPAPAFEVKDATGKTHKLEDFKGKWTVLEWHNLDCPYVKKHYGAGNMQKLQSEYTNKGVVWLSVISSAQGKQGYLDPAAATKHFRDQKAAPTAVLIDADGKMGKAYGAKTTPHMYVINPEGMLVYAGAIDDNDSADPAVIAKSKNYVRAALDEGMAGKAISTSSTRPYGCSVKYQ